MLRTITLYEQLSIFEASNDFVSELQALYADLQRTRAGLEGQVNNLVSRLYRTVLNNNQPANKAGIFSRIKNWWRNLWGRKQTTTPNYAHLGTLGRTDLEPPTVEEYRIINDATNSLCEAIEANGQDPLIIKILNGWSSQLKGVVSHHLDQMMSRVQTMIARATRRQPLATPIARPKDTTPKANEPKANEPKANEPKANEPEVDEPKANEPKANEPKANEPEVDEPEVDEPEVDEPEVDEPEVDEPEDESKGPPTTPQEILGNEHLNYVRGVLNRHVRIPVTKLASNPDNYPGITEEDKKIILAVHHPYLSLFAKGNKTKLTIWNLKGTNGVGLTSNNKGQLPFRIPTVLRIGDPRLDILKRYYPRLYEILDSEWNPDASKIEQPGEDEMDVQRRIKRLLPTNAVPKGRKHSTSGMPPEDQTDDAPPKSKERIPTGAMGDFDEPESDRPKNKGYTVHGLPPLDADRDENGKLKDPPSTAAPEGDGSPNAVPKFLTDAADKTDPNQHKALVLAWSNLIDRKDKDRFRKLVKHEKYDAALLLAKTASHDEDDDEGDVLAKLGEASGNGRTSLSEILLRRLRQQRQEGVKPVPLPLQGPISVSRLKSAMKEQMAARYAQSV